MATLATGAVEDSVVRQLRAALRGQVIDRAHPEYDRARQGWNGLVDRYPTVIARCAGVADVVEAVRIANAHRPPVSIRGGGHQAAGSGVCDDGLVIDMSDMRAIRVDPHGRRARAQPGATWGEFDRETQLFGLATTGGEVSTTGVAGLTLGGGMGLLMRAYGLSCDNLRSIDIVTADGIVRTASRDEHPELFWAARGGGRGLGVVTSFEFDLRPFGPDIAAARVFYPYQDAEQIMRAWPEVALSAPEAVSPELLLWSVPPDPAIPAELHGRKTVMVRGVYAGSPGAAWTALAPLREFGTPLWDLSGTLPYTQIQSSIDAMFPAGGRYYMKSHFLAEMTDEAISAVLEWDSRRPTPETLIALRTLGGAAGRVGPSGGGAYPHRAAAFNLSIDASWFDPELDPVATGWARAAWDALRQHANGGVYLNFSGLGEEAEGLRGSVYGRNRDRLAEVQAAYDPDGLFELAAGLP